MELPQYTELGEGAAAKPSDAWSTAGGARRRVALRACGLAVLGLSALVAVHASLCALVPMRPMRFGSHAASASSLATEGEAEGAEQLLVLAIGDWGGIPVYPYVTPAQLAVRDAMVATARGSTARKKLVLAVGDNFYSTGVTSASDPRFQQTFEDVYVNGYPELGAKDMWRVVAGNRTPSSDRGRPRAIARSRAPRRRARCPPPSPFPLPSPPLRAQTTITALARSARSSRTPTCPPPGTSPRPTMRSPSRSATRARARTL